METLKSIEKLSRILQQPVTDPEHCTYVVFLVYKTVEANPNITIGKLTETLMSSAGLSESSISGAITTLTSPSLLYGVTRFQRKKSSYRSSYLTVRGDRSSSIFKAWLAEVELKPEMTLVIPPVLQVPPKPNTEDSSNETI